jgi:hypothetical protein
LKVVYKAAMYSCIPKKALPDDLQWIVGTEARHADVTLQQYKTVRACVIDKADHQDDSPIAYFSEADADTILAERVYAWLESVDGRQTGLRILPRP